MRNLRITIAFTILPLVCHAAAAGQCLEKKPSANLSAYSAVFSGKVIDLEPTSAMLKVERVWKGDLTEAVKVELLYTPSAEDVSRLAALAGEGEKNTEFARINLLKGGNYLVYAFGARALDRDTIVPSCRTKKIEDAGADLAVLGDGLSIRDLPTAAQRPPDIPAIQDGRIRFPANYKVIIEAQGPPDYTIAVFGALSTNAQQLERLERVSPNHHLVLAGLRNGEQASFVTTDITSDHTIFEIQTTRVQEKPLTSLRDEGEIEAGVLLPLSKASGTPGTFIAELAELPRGFKLRITGSPAAPSSIPQRGNEIVPFRHVNRLAPNISTHQDVLSILGPPDAKDESGTQTILNYERIGLRIFLKGENAHLLAIISSIEVKAPFDGKTPDGLCIGQSEEEALKIVRANYHVNHVGKHHVSLAKKRDEESTFAIWFEGGKISRMGLW